MSESEGLAGGSHYVGMRGDIRSINQRLHFLVYRGAVTTVRRPRRCSSFSGEQKLPTAAAARYSTEEEPGRFLSWTSKNGEWGTRRSIVLLLPPLTKQMIGWCCLYNNPAANIKED